MGRAEELAQKQYLVQERVAAQLQPLPVVLPIWAPAQTLPSRSKAKLSVSGTAKHPVVGLLTYDGRKVEAKELLDCPLHLPPINRLLDFLAHEGITELKLEPYDPKSQHGELKAVIIMGNADASEMILRFVVRSAGAQSRIQPYVAKLLSTFPELKVVSVNIQPIPHAILEGREEILLTPASRIREQFDTFFLEFGPQSFKQVTHDTAQALYTKARELAAQRPIRQLLDIYCGSGAFSLALADVVDAGVGIEISADAVACAIAAATDSHQPKPHLKFYVADADASVNSLCLSPDLVVVNPPRRGLSRSLISELIEMAPDRILYSSCNPLTLVRDLQLLSGSFQTLELYPFDMFPLTEHLEVLALLELR